MSCALFTQNEQNCMNMIVSTQIHSHTVQYIDICEWCDTTTKEAASSTHSHTTNMTSNMTSNWEQEWTWHYRRCCHWWRGVTGISCPYTHRTKRIWSTFRCRNVSTVYRQQCNNISSQRPWYTTTQWITVTVHTDYVHIHCLWSDNLTAVQKCVYYYYY